MEFKSVKCPSCGSKHVAEILYGMPAFNKEVDAQIKSGEIVVGGKLEAGICPVFHCHDCGKDFGAKTDDFALEFDVYDYKESTQKIKFSLGSFFDGYSGIELTKTTEDCYLEIKPNMAHLQNFDIYKLGKQPLSEDIWNHVLDVLYDEIFVIDWDNHYESVRSIDERLWWLDITLNDDVKRNYSGSNAYPIYWKELLVLFSPLFMDFGIRIR